jgi:hypothetical protein
MAAFEDLKLGKAVKYGAVMAAVPLVIWQLFYWGGGLLSERYGTISYLLAIFTVVFGIAFLAFSLIRLRNKHFEGQVSFMDIAVHGIVIGLTFGAVTGVHDAVMFTQVAPDMEERGFEEMIKGMDKLIESNQDDPNLLEKFTKQQEELRRRLETSRETEASAGNLVYGAIIRGLVGGLFMGILMGIMLRSR